MWHVSDAWLNFDGTRSLCRWHSQVLARKRGREVAGEGFARVWAGRAYIIKVVPI